MHAIGIQRKEIYSVIFEIKRVQFSITVKRLVIDKADYYSLVLFGNIIRQVLSEYCIMYRFLHYTGVYHACFNIDSSKEIGGSFTQYSSICD